MTIQSIEINPVSLHAVRRTLRGHSEGIRFSPVIMLLVSIKLIGPENYGQ